MEDMEIKFDFGTDFLQHFRHWKAYKCVFGVPMMLLAVVVDINYKGNIRIVFQMTTQVCQTNLAMQCSHTVVILP